jgi:hypothetical protein
MESMDNKSPDADDSTLDCATGALAMLMSDPTGKLDAGVKLATKWALRNIGGILYRKVV